MKRIFSICLAFIALLQIAKAQTSTVTGTVKDEQGNPLHYVFVHDSQSKSATFTDSLGNFTVQLYPNAKVQFESVGHSDTVLNVDKATANLQVVLRSLSSGGSSNVVQARVKLITQPVRTDVTNGDMSALASGSTISGIAHQKGDTRGNRYMFDVFVPGYVLSTSGAIVYNEIYRFDYDKIGGALLLTEDNNNVTEVPENQIKTFTLFGTGDQQVTFEKVPAIDNAHYVQVLASGAKYNIYKSIKTRLVKASYVNAGITAHGNDYDEFVDDVEYYAVDLKTNQLQKLSLKKKSIKADFAGEADKVNKYLADHSGSIDDAYLSAFGLYMNQ